jgi:hypothetical protein
MGDYFYKTTLIKERDWTEKLISRFLGSPDKRVKNPHYSKMYSYLYDKNKVTEAENDPDFITLKNKKLKEKKNRQAGSKKAMQTKINIATEWAKNVVINIEIKDLQVLSDEAMENYNSHHEAAIDSGRKQEIEYLDYKSSFGSRVIRNYLRHCCSDYELYISINYGKTGVNEAYDIIRERIEKCIDNIYPELI